MEFLLLIQLMTTIFLSTSCIKETKGFATDKCSHDQLKSQMIDMFKCQNEVNNNYMDEFSKVSRERMAKKQEKINLSKMCPVSKKAYEEQILCADTLIKTCFDEKIMKIFSYASEILKSYGDNLWNCHGSTTSILQIQTQMKTQIGEFLEKTKSVIGDYPQNKGYLMSIIKFDKHCSYEQRRKSIMEENLMCFPKHAQDLVSTVVLFERSTPKSIPLCTTVEEIMRHCFNANACFSQQEMNFIRDLISTYFSLWLDSLLKMSQHFGGGSGLMKTYAELKEQNDVLNSYWGSANSRIAGGHFTSDHGSTQLTDSMDANVLEDIRTQQEKSVEMYGSIIDLIIEDYKTGNCKTILNEFSFLSSASHQLLPRFISLLFLSFGVFFFYY